MLSKNQIDKKLKLYIKEHSKQGYSKHALKKVLINHGYNEAYIDNLLRKNSESEFVRKYAVIISLLFIISIFSLNFIPLKKQQQITGYSINYNNPKTSNTNTINTSTYIIRILSTFFIATVISIFVIHKIKK